PRRLISDSSGELDIHVLDLVAARHGQPGEEDHSPSRGRSRGAGVANNIVLEADDSTVIIEGDLKVVKLLPATDQEALRPILNPLDRAQGQHRQEADQWLLRVTVHLQPKRPTEVRNNDADPILRHPQRTR